MFKNLRLSQQGLILLLVPLIFEVAFVASLGWQMYGFDQLMREVNRSRDFGTTVNDIVHDLYQIAHCIDRVKSGIKQGDMPPGLSGEMRHEVALLNSGIDRLLIDSPNEDMTAKVTHVQVTCRRIQRVIDGLMDMYESGNRMALFGLFSSGNPHNPSAGIAQMRDELLESLQALLQAKEQQQVDYDAKIAQQEASFQRLMRIIYIGGAFHVMLALLLWLNFTRGTTERFRIVMDNTRRLAAGMPLNPPIGGKGEIAHLDRVFNDMADALAAARKKEREIMEMKQQFVAMVSHDLRTPLTSMQGFLTLLETGMYGELSQPGLESRAIAEANVKRLIALINDLLDIEKLESGKLEMELSEVPLRTVFDRSVAAVQGFAEQHDVTICVEPTELVAFADGDRLVQVLVNLLSNAVKFSPEASTVSLQAVEQPEGLRITVTDRGRGVPVEFQQSIFERFQQVQSADAKIKGGSGLGLAICKAIVEGHNGQIGVDSEPGAGSTFWFQIPKQPATLKQMA